MHREEPVDPFEQLRREIFLREYQLHIEVNKAAIGSGEDLFYKARFSEPSGTDNYQMVFTFQVRTYFRLFILPVCKINTINNSSKSERILFHISPIFFVAILFANKFTIIIGKTQTIIFMSELILPPAYCQLMSDEA